MEREKDNDLKLKIEYVDIHELKEYIRNAREHSRDDVNCIKESIKEFGFCDPIGIADDGTIIEGHGRLQALRELGINTAPVIRLKHLSDEQRRAYTLAHNRTAELSKWDKKAVSFELDKITTINMDTLGFSCGFDFNLPDPLKPKVNERERTMEAYNLDDVDFERVAGKYEIPTLKPTTHIPTDLISFNYVLNTDQYDKGVHFYIDDYQFERVWNDPYKYLDILNQFDCVLTPDFSLYLEMPIAMQIWNVYRSRLIGQMLQDVGVKVIPTLQWCREASFDFCFDGLPKRSVVSVSTIGVKRAEESKNIWIAGMDEAIRRLDPSHVIVYGGDIGYKFGCEVTYIGNRNTERMKEIKNKNKRVTAGNPNDDIVR